MMHGFIPPHRFFPYLTWTDIQDLPDKQNIVIIQAHRCDRTTWPPFTDRSGFGH